jgi:hypothetical protein
LSASSEGSSMSTVLLRSSVTELRSPQRAGERENVGDNDVVSWSVDETVAIVERDAVREAVPETDDDRVSVVVTVNVDSAFVKVADAARVCVCVTLSSPRVSDSASVMVTLDDIVSVDVGPSTVRVLESVDELRSDAWQTHTYTTRLRPNICSVWLALHLQNHVVDTDSPDALWVSVVLDATPATETADLPITLSLTDTEIATPTRSSTPASTETASLTVDSPTSTLTMFFASSIKTGPQTAI